MGGVQNTHLSLFNAMLRTGSAPPESLPFATCFMHPDEVADDPVLTSAQKREILASWASDIHAVPGAPALRQLDNGPIIHIDRIFDALRSLDESKDAPQTPTRLLRRFAGLELAFRNELRSARETRPDDDDDDPPPFPAMAVSPRGGPLFGGAAVDPELSIAA